MAYERAATACASSAAMGQCDGDSDGTTPRRYVSSERPLTTETPPPWLRSTSVPWYSRPSNVSGARAQSSTARCPKDMPAPFFLTGKTSRGPTPYVPGLSIRVSRLPSVTLICVAQPTVTEAAPCVSRTRTWYSAAWPIFVPG